MTRHVTLATGICSFLSVLLVVGCLSGSGSDGQSQVAGFRVAAVMPEEDDRLDSLDSALEVTFSADVDPNTVNAQSLRVMDLMGHQSVPGKVEYEGATRIARFTPFNGWMPNGHYKATVHHRVQSKQGAKHLPASYSWEFSAPKEPPQVFHLDPFDGEVDVSPKTSVMVLFGEPMDSTTINESSFQLVDSTGVIVPGRVIAPEDGAGGHGGGHPGFGPMPVSPPSQNAGADHAILIPTNPLQLNMQYTVKLLPTIKSFVGPAYAGSQTSFTTAKSISSTVLFGSDADDVVAAVVANASGTYVVGGTFGALKSATSVGQLDMFLSKRDAQGNEIWSTQFGTAGYDSARGLAVDSDGTSYVVGVSDPNVTGNVVAASPQSGVLYKLSPTGKVIKTVGLNTTSGYSTIENIISDGAGSLYVSGFFDGELEDRKSQGVLDVFIAKYDAATLARSWLEVKGTVGFEGGGRMALSQNGTLYWAVSTDGDFNAPSKKPMTFMSKVWIYKFDLATKSVVTGWPIQLSGEQGRSAAGMGFDSAGDFYVGGTVYGDQTFFGPTDTDGFVVKLNAQTGAEVETVRWGTQEPEEYVTMLVQPDGSMLLGGWLWGMSAPRPDGSSQSINSAHITKIRLPAAVWTTQIRSKESGEVSGLAVSPSSGEVIVVGTARGGFDGQTTQGGGDGFFTRLDPNEGKVK